MDVHGGGTYNPAFYTQSGFFPKAEDTIILSAIPTQPIIVRIKNAVQLKRIAQCFFILFLGVYCLSPVFVRADDSAPAAQRIASLNLCVDQILLQLVPRERIVSLTSLAANPSLSMFADRVGDIHLNRGLAEQLVPLQPDLVLAGQYTDGAAVSMLKRLGVRVETVALPRTLDEIRGYIQHMGVLLGAEDRAAVMLAAMERQFKQLQDKQLGTGGGKIRALMYSANGITFGAGTLEHELLTLAGYENVAASMGFSGYAHLSLEHLIQAHPQRLVINDPSDTGFSIAQDNLRHPVLKRLVPSAHRIVLPSALSVCTALSVVPLIEALEAKP